MMKKRIISIILSSLLVLSLAGCSQGTGGTSDGGSGAGGTGDAAVSAEVGDGQSGTGAQDGAADASGNADGQGTADGGSNVLIAYFSWSGNTETMATHIQEATGGDLYEIVPAVAYPEDYNECGDVALEERDSNARPEIQNLPESLDGYDTLFIGYPKLEQGFTCV